MSKNRKQHSQGRTVGLILLGIVCLGLLIKVLLHGHNVALFNPKGMIAQEQLNLMVLTVGIMLIIAIPALFLLFFTAWKYRESNTKATHDPNARHGKLFNVGIWLVPSIFAIVLAMIMWPATHRLAPQKTIAADAKPLTIQVISMRWKWLFIYPEQKIATVNFVQVPVDTPVQFELTADDAPMSSFWIPNLSGMLYTMTGHSNRLNLIANTTGDYPGRSGEINGAGFAGMQFTARASSSDDFNQWVNKVQTYGGSTLDITEYNRLLQPSEDSPTAFYSATEGGLYDTVLMKYMGNMEMDEGQTHDEGHSYAEHGAHHE
jgi:cytochrome o ubiquinol oxidase subunit 2